MKTSNPGWKECKLGVVCSFQEGYVNPPQSYPEYFDGNIKWLRATDLNNGYVYNTSRTLTEKGFHSAGKSAILFKPNTIGISKSGTIGRLGIIKDYMCGNRAVINIMPSEDVDTPFIYYALLNRRNEIEQLAVGSVQKNLYVPVLAELDVQLPPLPTQRRIAAVLSSLDDKIELNNRINANLEAQAQALFRSWFVDFEPWGGEMPEGWKIVSVADLKPILETGKRPKGGAVASGIPSIGAENVKQLGVFDFSAEKFIPEEFARSMTRGLIQGYELLLYKDGGKPGTFFPHFSMFGEGFPHKKCFINEHVFKLDFGDSGYNIFAYFYFQTAEIYQWLESCGMKAAIPGINQNCVLEIKIPHPDNPRIAEFGMFAKPLFQRLFKGCLENRSLSALRDALLPKLMSGEIDVEQVEIPA